MIISFQSIILNCPFNFSVVHEAKDGSSLEDSIFDDAQEVTEDSLTLKCDSCRRKFKKKSNLDKHMEKHQNTDISCKQCKVYFHRQEDLTAHRLRYHRHLCDLCGRVFVTSYNVREHMQIVHKFNLNVKEFLCDYCGQSFTRDIHLQDHKTAMHSDEKPHSCKTCGTAFARKRTYQAHVKRCGIVTEKFKCSSCEKEFASQGSLKNHIDANHSGEINECEKCKRTFKYKSNLWRHLKVCRNR